MKLQVRARMDLCFCRALGVEPGPADHKKMLEYECLALGTILDA